MLVKKWSVLFFVNGFTIKDLTLLIYIYVMSSQTITFHEHIKNKKPGQRAPQEYFLTLLINNAQGTIFLI